MSAVNRNQKLYYHRLGTPQSADELIYSRPDEPDWGYDAEVSDDGYFAIIHVWEGTDPKNRVYFIDLDTPNRPRITAPVVKLIDEADAAYRFVQNEGQTFILRTDLEAPRGRLLGISITQPRRQNWRTIGQQWRAGVRAQNPLAAPRELADDRAAIADGVARRRRGRLRSPGAHVPGEGSLAGEPLFTARLTAWKGRTPRARHGYRCDGSRAG